MALSVNPVSQLVQKVDAEVSAALEAVETGIPKIGNALEKAKLDLKVAQLGGDLGSGLNMAGVTGPELLDNVTTGMGNVVNNNLGGGLPVDLTGVDGASEAVGTFGSIVDNASAKFGNPGFGNEISNLASKFTGGNLAGGAQALAGKIASGAGALNDFLSLKRGANLPKGGELFQSSGEGIEVLPQNGEDWRVKIACDWSLFPGNPQFELLQKSAGVVFPILPDITFSTKANYTQIDPIHNNYPFQAYKNSQIDEIMISGEFIVEDETQAAYWIAMTTFFKTMTKMFFGQGANVGAPPPICRLTGYGASVFDNIPVVVKSFSVDLTSDVNYKRCNAFGTNTWVPITSGVNITVQPVYNRRNLRQFSLVDYAKGNLDTPSGLGYL
jgi:hypothetical protein